MTPTIPRPRNSKHVTLQVLYTACVTEQRHMQNKNEIASPRMMSRLMPEIELKHIGGHDGHNSTHTQFEARDTASAIHEHKKNRYWRPRNSKHVTLHVSPSKPDKDEQSSSGDRTETYWPSSRRLGTMKLKNERCH